MGGNRTELKQTSIRWNARPEANPVVVMVSMAREARRQKRDLEAGAADPYLLGLVCRWTDSTLAMSLRHDPLATLQCPNFPAVVVHSSLGNRLLHRAEALAASLGQIHHFTCSASYFGFPKRDF
jgi:hypothetical protein